ncbi:hypothetical protein [Rhizobium sullae]|uniref:hypothetical protein n=1 Tax=Rhizobium sullae TaxID=50338 RepID=UPI00117A4B42|nr:hypothetical protein [Rhizobium sullae]
MLETLSSPGLPAAEDALQDCFSVVKGLFSRIALGDTSDWYTVSRLLGYPSSELARATSWRMSWARMAIRVQDAEVYEIVRSRIVEDHCLEMLGNYLDMAVDAAHPLDEFGWAYILWSSSEWDILHIGAAAGSVEHVVKRLDREHPDHNAFGVLATWLLHDPLDAYRRIHERLFSHAIGDGFFRIALGDAKAVVEQILRDTGNVSHSPWHGDQGVKNGACHTTSSGEDLYIR